MTLPFGIDISKHQGTNDYAKMRANASFVFVKATESWGYTDPKFYANWQGLIGHNRGAYCYVWLSDDPLRQANHLIDIVTQAGVDWKYDRLVLDLEKSGHGLSKAEVSRRVLVMMERIKEVTGRYPILYSRADWVNDNMLLNDPRLINADWWLATYRKTNPEPQYTPEAEPPPYLPKGVNRWLIHQTSSHENGKRFGVGSYYVDTNRFNGTKAELDSYFGQCEVVPPEPEPPVEKLFDARVYSWATPYVNIRKEPSINSEDLGDLYPNTVVGVTSITGEWYRISNGFVMSRYLERLDLPLPITEKYYGALYWQRDPRWKDKPLGTSGTIGSYGCVMTAETNVLNQLGIVTNPVVNNAWRTANGGYHNGNLIVWEKVSEQHPDIIWEGKTWNPTDAQIKQKIAAGYPLVMLVDHNEGTPVLDEHWVNSIPSPADDDAIWIHDPWDNLTIRLRDRYKKPIQQFSSYRRVR